MNQMEKDLECISLENVRAIILVFKGELNFYDFAWI